MLPSLEIFKSYLDVFLYHLLQVALPWQGRQTGSEVLFNPDNSAILFRELEVLQVLWRGDKQWGLCLSVWLLGQQVLGLPCVQPVQAREAWL